MEIYIVDLADEHLENLTNHPGRDWIPRWSPSGKYIAFNSERDGNREIYLINPGGDNLLRITDNPAYDGWIQWVP